MTKTHDSNGKRHTSDNGLATWQGHLDPLTGDRVLTAWSMPKVPQQDPFPGIAEDDGRVGIVKSGGSLYFRLF